MKKIVLLMGLLLIIAAIVQPVNAQGFLKKIKDKANQAAEKMLDKKIAEKTGTSTDSDGSGQTGSKNGKTGNTTGEGLKNTTPPDVTQQILDAEKAHKTGSYSEARYAVQQALLGVEVQIGQKILIALPATVNGLPKDTLEDRVTSTQWGWANLTILRMYKKDDKQLTVMIGNNPLFAGFADMYFSNTYSTQSNGETQNVKQVKIKGYKAAIKFEQSEGYTVLIQLGQSGMMTCQGVNFATEQEITNAVSVFDIDSIKRMLGEK